AEDGIRDRNVTGVQTCALPIFISEPSGSSPTNESALGHATPSFLNSKAIAAQERTQETGVVTTNTVGVFSMARRNRNHQVEIMRRKVFGGVSARLSTMKPNPPPCNKRSTVLKAFSSLSLQRTHNSRSKLTPALADDERSNVSQQSTNAHVSSFKVAAANAEISKLVRPQDAAPYNSVIAPLGKPPKAVSMAAMPVGTS